MPAVSPAMVAIAAAVLVTFIGGLYFITHHKKEESETLQNQKVTGNGLPPKPEERWRYIKELESRQPGVRTPTEPSAGGEVMNPNQLTSEQRQLLEQMQADMRQQPTQLNEVPWNEQTPANATAPASGAAAAVGSNAACSATTYAAAGKRTVANAHGTVRPGATRAPKSAAEADGLAATLSGFAANAGAYQRGSAKSRAHYARA